MSETLMPLPEHTPPEVAYIALDYALEQHRKPVCELDPRQAEELLTKARQRYRLEQRILSSSEGHVSQVPDSTLRDAESKIRQRYDTAAELHTDLARNGLNADGLRAALRHFLRVDAVLAHVREQAPEVGELDARLYYHAHRSDFDLPETRSARHLLITVNAQFPENSRPAVRRRIEALRRELAHEPDRFAELAQRHSECPTALEGGQLGRLRRGTLYPELDKALFSLPEGGLSPVLKSPIGMHLLHCERIHPARIIEEEQALPRIRALLTQQRQEDHERQWLEEIESELR
jgi:peptidyl-prolyl cis-trans isomerase C